MASADEQQETWIAKWLRQMTTALSFAALVSVPALSEAASSCSASDPYLDTYNLYDQGLITDDVFSTWMHAYGGVTLNKTLTLLNGLDQIRGAAYDPAKGEVVFMGEGEIPVAEKIDIDDLNNGDRFNFEMTANVA